MPAAERQEQLLAEPPVYLPLQCRLTVGAPDDPLEKEADAMADTIMRMVDQPGITFRQSMQLQRKCAACEEEEEVQRKPLMPFIQRKSSESNTAVSDTVADRISSTRGAGNGMDDHTQSFMENSFGADFSGIRIHTGDYAVQLSRELNAQAFTLGNDIYFNSGKYDPSSGGGRHLLAHELTHTLQQSGLVERKVQRLLDCSSTRAVEEGIRNCRAGLDVSTAASIGRSLVCLGITEEMLGDLNTITTGATALSEAERTAAFELLMTLTRGGGLYGPCNRIIRSWNVNKDDLGPTGVAERGRYPTILHYMRALTWLGSGGTTTTDSGAYPAAARSFPMITLAGATSGTMRVHPRNVYFVASAQVRMDILSGLDETAPIPGSDTGRMRIHYIAPGGVSRQIRNLRLELRPMRRTPTRRRPTPADHLDAYNNIVGQLFRLRAIIQQQEEEESETTTGDEASHSESAMRAWFTANEAAFDALRPLTTLAEVPAQATALYGMLGSVPRPSDLNHGFGAVDPHGTDHALGFAIDLFNGTSSVQNFGLESAYLPFVNFVVDNFTHTYESGGETHEIDFRGGTRIASTQQLPPELARDLSILLQEKGQEAYNQIVSQRETIRAATRDRPAERRDLVTIASVRRLLRRYMPQLRALINRQHRELRADEGFVDMVEAALDRIRYHIRMADSFSPQQLSDLLAEDVTDLDNIVGEALTIMPVLSDAGVRAQIEANNTELAGLGRGDGRRRRQLQRENSRLTREAGRLNSIFDELDRLDTVAEGTPPTDIEAAGALVDTAIADDGMQTRFEARRLAALLEVVDNRAFVNWLTRVRARGIYTQPPLMVTAINEVRSFANQEDMVPGQEHRHTHFQGGHHWQIAPREIITDDGAYLTALRRDMDHRSVSDLQRIVRTINEWDAARGMLTTDTVFLNALGRSMTRTEGESETAAGRRLVSEALAQ